MWVIFSYSIVKKRYLLLFLDDVEITKRYETVTPWSAVRLGQSPRAMLGGGGGGGVKVETVSSSAHPPALLPTSVVAAILLLCVTTLFINIIKSLSPGPSYHFAVGIEDRRM